MPHCLCAVIIYVMSPFGEYLICVHVNLNIHRILLYAVKCSHHCGNRKVGKIYRSDFEITNQFKVITFSEYGFWWKLCFVSQIHLIFVVTLIVRFSMFQISKVDTFLLSLFMKLFLSKFHEYTIWLHFNAMGNK